MSLSRPRTPVLSRPVHRPRRRPWLFCLRAFERLCDACCAALPIVGFYALLWGLIVLGLIIFLP